jgi:hypothetical protein
MQANNLAIFNILNVDHIGFNENLGGYHTVIHQPPQNENPTVVTGIGQTFTKTEAGDQQLFYESGNGVVTQLSNPSNIQVVAAVNFTVAATVITIQNSYNVSSVTRASIGQYLVTFTNALSTQYYYPAITCQAATILTALPSSVAGNAFAYVPTTTTIRLAFGNTAVDPFFASVIIFA